MDWNDNSDYFCTHVYNKEKQTAMQTKCNISQGNNIKGGKQHRERGKRVMDNREVSKSRCILNDNIKDIQIKIKQV